MPQNLHFKIAKTRDGKMQKILMLAFVFVFFAESAIAEIDVAPADVLSAWGNPKAAHDAAVAIAHKHISANSGGNVLLVYMARKIVAHGGYFCATTFDGQWYADYGRWTIYKRPFGENCAWYCEDGFAGENCAAGTGSACNVRKMSQSNLDAASASLGHPDIEEELRNDKGMFTRSFMSGEYEIDTILAATNFLANGRGITATPISFMAGATDFSAGAVTMNAISAEVKTSTSNVTKTLCAEGWAGADCSKNVCKCASEKQKADENGNCVPKNSWTMDEMTNKTYKDNGKDIPCWHLSDIAKYQECMIN
jgi:hypothetical protein